MPVRARLLIALLTIVLTGLIVWAIRAGEFGAAGDFLTQRPWGIVTLVDLYFGFVISALLIGWTERKVWLTLVWAMPIFVLGNVWTGVWLVFRGPRLYRKLVDKTDPEREPS